ncbi:MAG: CDP-archaeol synthase [Anaerolineales bacterium]|jgi:phosphatidate cytidylyltransferase
MLRERTAVVLLLLPLVLWVLVAGGWFFAAAIALVLALAGSEFAQLFRNHGRRPALPMIVAGIVGIVLCRQLFGFEHTPLILVTFLGVSLIWHLVDFERGANGSATDYALTVAGTIYLGWIGAYLVSLRNLPDGQWWVLLALPAIWLADTGAYFVGRALGRHKLSPRLSPNKTWEGYLAGVFVGGAISVLFALLWRVGAGPDSELNAWRGFGLGIVVAIIAPLGDLGISMIKRELNVKDSGSLLPGHGGALDRLDTWIWAGMLGFYMVSWMT